MVHPAALLVMIVFGYAYLRVANTAVMGALLPAVAAFMWRGLGDASANNNSTYDFSEQLKRFSVMLAPLTACLAFLNDANFALMMRQELDVTEMSTWISVFAMTGGIVFWGWGFDTRARKVQNVWIFMAVLCTVLCLMDSLGSLRNFIVITIALCDVVGMGGLVLFAAHMMTNSDGCYVVQASVFMVLLGVGQLMNILVDMLIMTSIEQSATARAVHFRPHQLC